MNSKTRESDGQTDREESDFTGRCPTNVGRPTKTDSDLTGISESGINKDKSPINCIHLKGYFYKYCPVKSAADGTLLYISNHLSVEPRNYFCIYKFTELESAFIKILNPKK